MVRVHTHLGFKGTRRLYLDIILRVVAVLSSVVTDKLHHTSIAKRALQQVFSGITTAAQIFLRGCLLCLAVTENQQV